MPAAANRARECWTSGKFWSRNKPGRVIVNFICEFINYFINLLRPHLTINKSMDSSKHGAGWRYAPSLTVCAPRSETASRTGEVAGILRHEYIGRNGGSFPIALAVFCIAAG